MCDNLQMICAVCRIGIYSVWQRICCRPPPVDKPEFTVLCVGLSKAGKSSVLALLSGEAIDTIEPTVGFSIKAVMLEDCILNVKELGGGDNVRPYWDRYYQGSEAVIYVMSSSCSEAEWETNKVEFEKVASHSTLRSLPLLVLITGQDKEGGRSTDQISQHLDLPSSSGKRFVTVQSCNTDDRVAIRSAFKTLSEKLLKKIGTASGKGDDKDFSRI